MKLQTALNISIWLTATVLMGHFATAQDRTGGLQCRGGNLKMLPVMRALDADGGIEPAKQSGN
ncbi:MAG: hypothetical protein HKN23_05520 [Verrucomicrobiales bacterium]|nr:hypothetical protein [Verrucomicrobiales bacterium]